MPISQSPMPRFAACFFATLFVGFGVNAMVNPEAALSFFELKYPLLQDQKNIVDVLSMVYGVRDIFMGVAIFATAYFGTTPALGWILVAAGACAGVDGWACKTIVGQAEMNHWGYAPVVGVLGLVLAAGL
ncbi:hypothetical protein M409DRAFT_37497 [Zasmidium cellare ATCC 36951]|uniref:Integral membrane protein n=1 Tax=Zasmidium cellare ATCC 36951 TaxID=1080233 RepID=A0A6A6C3T8_ZASCE|nr:uncharacterized protein M409DRAFT_37497 [Zasmidium cellare ATCC 36951]KAF2161807.1 hypothetical protein M409DRAFT_37497 [Zasmidium cellare ATCC 36951]